MSSHLLNVGIAQYSPIWLDKKATTSKILQIISDAGNQGVELLTFGEAFLPGYPFWVELTNGAKFNSPTQKELFAHYANQAVHIPSGDLDSICAAAKEKSMSIYLGTIERAADRGSHSLYCSLVYIDQDGEIKSVHRKLQPTYEERLVWSPGDGNGLVVHPKKDFTIGGLNCWENWMPLPRAALYGQGEDVHIAVWPGSDHNTRDITRFVARESRSYMISASTIMTKEMIGNHVPHFEEITEYAPEVLANGGSCIAGPDGEWLIEPKVGAEELIVLQIDKNRIFEERQNFDPVGHYSRPDVTQLTVNKERQSTVRFSK